MKYLSFLLFFCLLTVSAELQAQPPTVGLISHTTASYDSGYVLFAPLSYTQTYLIDKCGKVVRTWNSEFIPGESAYLRPDGKLVRSGHGAGGSGSKKGSSCTEIFDWDGNLLWRFTIDTLFGQHHDFEIMPNGNVLLIVHQWIQTQTAVAAGRDPALISGQFVSERLVEIEPIGTDSGRVVWEWRPFDHLVQDFDATKANFGVVADHPELINFNYTKTAVGEWLHFNSVRYNEKLDQILVSAHHLSEIWVIDHGTTTAQAASHSGGKRGKGGDLLYRLGNPQAYDHGRAIDQVFFGQHECMWIPEGRPQAGKIMVFNNGTGRPAGMYSSLDVITPPIDSAGNYSATIPFLPAALDWTYTDTPPTNIITQTAGGGEMLPNGNVMICTGQMGSIFEIDASHTKKVWEYVIPVNNAGPIAQGSIPSGNPVYKAVFYPMTYPAFAGKTIVPGAPIELNATNNACAYNDGSSAVHAVELPVNDLFVYPNPASGHVNVASGERVARLALYDALGRNVATAENAGELNTVGVPAGVYLLVVTHKGATTSKTIAIVH